MNKNRIIYALCCPVTNEIHYVGKSEKGLIRPTSHLTKSHSDKINEWVDDLKVIGHKPTVKILEYVDDIINIYDREKYWINKCLEDGATLLNETLVSAVNINPDNIYRTINKDYDFFDVISKFVKDRRKITGMTQIEYAERIGVALTVLRKIEQGNKNISLKSLLTVLSGFNATISISMLKKHHVSQNPSANKCFS